MLVGVLFLPTTNCIIFLNVIRVRDKFRYMYMQRPVAFASRTLQSPEKNYGVSEMEALGVVWAVKHFRPYLYGHRCEVITDHEALKAQCMFTVEGKYIVT